MLNAFARWLYRKTMPQALLGRQWTGTHFVDSYKRTRNPTPNELLAELKGAAWTCISINASVCASFPPQLYVATQRGQAQPKCATRSLGRGDLQRIKSLPHLSPSIKAAQQIQQVTEHPLLTLLQNVNPIHNSFDLLELTQVYLEVHGKAFWYVHKNLVGVPDEIWILPAQNITPKRRPGSTNPVDYYEYRNGREANNFQADDVIFFRYPDPRDPYLGGLSPLRACYEQVVLTSEYSATKSAVYENRGIPSAVVSPAEVIGEEERDRLETQWNEKFRRGGSGRVVVAESGLRVDLLNPSLGDLAALADMKATKEDIANAFHVPLSFLTSETNLANLQAAEAQHMSKAIYPRLTRRDQKLNERLVPLFDPSGRLFLMSQDPTPSNIDLNMKQLELDLKYGLRTINEVRANDRGDDPVPWGDVPWLPLQWARTDFVGRAEETTPDAGRNHEQRSSKSD
jgi:HK97 family phage portal protein